MVIMTLISHVHACTFKHIFIQDINENKNLLLNYLYFTMHDVDTKNRFKLVFYFFSFEKMRF